MSGIGNRMKVGYIETIYSNADWTLRTEEYGRKGWVLWDSISPKPIRYYLGDKGKDQIVAEWGCEKRNVSRFGIAIYVPSHKRKGFDPALKIQPLESTPEAP